MNKKRDKECMVKFLYNVKVNGVQDLDLTLLNEFLPRSAHFIDFLSIGIRTGAGWNYPSSNTTYGIQANQGLSYQMLEDVEVKEIVAGISSLEEILETRKFFEKYLGKLNNSIVDYNLSFAVNFNYQVYSICELPTPLSNSTPTIKPWVRGFNLLHLDQKATGVFSFSRPTSGTGSGSNYLLLKLLNPAISRCIRETSE